MEELQVKRDVKIFATDVDSRAIEQAGKGFFSENIIDDVTPDRLARFFVKQNDQYQISKDIRRMIIFATHNMFSDPPFGKLDLISCRNVMIYFQPVLRRGLFAIFHSALKNNGYLFLGKSETAGEYVSLFKPICSAEHAPVTYTDITVDCPQGRRVIDLTVQPIPDASDHANELIAILFLENKIDSPGGIIEKYDIDATAARRIADLEHEFQVSQSDLRATIQRLETVNGELQAANEELLTANEELQSSTEELQSVNEELYTVNTEHQLKLDELTMMTNDMSNFLSSTMIGILFVDSELNIRKFTEYVGREFQLMEHDIGRPLQIFAHSFPDEQIEEDAKSVLKTLSSIDREVTAMNGRFYTLRIAPYRTTENSIRGLVITIIDSLGTNYIASGKNMT